MIERYSRQTLICKLEDKILYIESGMEDQRALDVLSEGPDYHSSRYSSYYSSRYSRDYYLEPINIRLPEPKSLGMNTILTYIHLLESPLSRFVCLGVSHQGKGIPYIKVDTGKGEFSYIYLKERSKISNFYGNSDLDFDDFLGHIPEQTYHLSSEVFIPNITHRLSSRAKSNLISRYEFRDLVRKWLKGNWWLKKYRFIYDTDIDVTDLDSFSEEDLYSTFIKVIDGGKEEFTEISYRYYMGPEDIEFIDEKIPAIRYRGFGGIIKFVYFDQVYCPTEYIPLRGNWICQIYGEESDLGNYTQIWSETGLLTYSETNELRPRQNWYKAFDRFPVNFIEGDIPEANMDYIMQEWREFIGSGG